MGQKGRRKPTPVNRPVPVEIADAEHELVIERAAAIDVAKTAGKVCVRLTGKNGRRFSRVWDLPARTGAITGLAEQLMELGIEKVTVESTSDYWRIWYYLLEDNGLDVQLVNARDVKNVPGRPKTDKLDAVWLAKLTEKGLLRPSFVPPAPIRVLRDYTRLREDLTRERSRYWQRLEKLLEDAAIKVSAVASTLDTFSTRDMVEALIAGERDPHRLADLARGRMKTKRSELITALDGRFDDHHAELARLLLGQIDALTAQIGTLSARIEQLIAAMDQADHDSGDPDASGAGGLQVTSGPHTGEQATAPGPGMTTAIGVDSDTATVVEPSRLARSSGSTRYRRRRPRRPDDHRRNWARHDLLCHTRAPGLLGETMPTHHPIRSGGPRRQDRQGQPLPERRARPGRRRSRPHRHLPG
ncbi:transposase IS116/IS110/IS902 family protein [Mycobacterium lentiflavum]|uniref:Transposase IS116/IS110/IS902 family protein n=1 Tax=Mycobacterium lentiflavum TaxID=141349 RepID=A0A0E4CR40_MYCLN|nr:transposase IS116/IS110/IS902 family protein [Mycobacterium lentiflavum]